MEQDLTNTKITLVEEMITGNVAEFLEQAKQTERNSQEAIGEAEGCAEPLVATKASPCFGKTICTL